MTGFKLPRLIWLVWLICFSLVWILPGSVFAQPDLTSPDPEIQGQKLAQSILKSWPEASSTNMGVLKIRDARHKTVQWSLNVQTVVLADEWQNIYQATETNAMAILKIIHSDGQPDQYFYPAGAAAGNQRLDDPASLMIPFAGSDFCLADLGLEFFHWPLQKVLRKEVRRSRGCTVLESTNPHPGPQSYSRVVSWIDEASNGIIHAEAYDFKNNLLKEFDPKTFKKVRGQWELQEMEIDNVQSGSRTRLELNWSSE